MSYQADFNTFRDQHPTSVATVGFVMEDDTLIRSSNTYCHAGLSGPELPKDKQIKFILSGMQKHNLDDTWRDRFIRYMLEESPWKSIFVNDSVEDVVKNHWRVTPEAPANFLTNGLVATRMISEFPAVAQTWIELVKQGIEPDFAHIVAHYIRASGKNFEFSPTKGHAPFDIYRPKVLIPRFLGRKPTAVGNPYQEVRSYSGHTSVWGSDSGQGDNHYKTIFNIKPPAQVKVKNLNIFFKEPETYRQMFKAADLPHVAQEIRKVAFG